MRAVIFSFGGPFLLPGNLPVLSVAAGAVDYVAGVGGVGGADGLFRFAGRGCDESAGLRSEAIASNTETTPLSNWSSSAIPIY